MSKVKLKICGIKSSSEAKLLLDNNVDYVGLNFVKDSSRRVTFETAISITNILKGSGIQTVALFRDQPLALINEYAEKLNVDYVQLHGGEDENFALKIIKPIIKAIPINDSTDTYEIIRYIASYPAKYFVLDREKQGQGEPVDLHIAIKIVNNFPDRVFLAGGLNPGNLKQTLSNIHPFGIDIAGGIRTDNILEISKVNEVLKIISDD